MTLRCGFDVRPTSAWTTSLKRELRRLTISVSAFAALETAGCGHATLCEPTSAALGQIVSQSTSDVYLAEVEKNGADVPHIACKAETTIATTRAFLTESEEAICSTSSGQRCLAVSHLNVMQGEFRVLGVGKGIGGEDCGDAAIRACNAGVAAYYNKERAVRPPTVACRLADYQNQCRPERRRSRGTATAVFVESEPPPEDRQPMTWVFRLADAKSQPVAIRALIHFYDDAAARSNQRVADPVIRDVLDQIVEPLVKVYVSATLERGTRILLIKFLSEIGDPRAGRAWIHACSGFATGGGPEEEDVRYASLAIGTARFAEAAAALGEAFAKLDIGAPQGAAAAKNVRDAIMQLSAGGDVAGRH